MLYSDCHFTKTFMTTNYVYVAFTCMMGRSCFSNNSWFACTVLQLLKFKTNGIKLKFILFVKLFL